MILTIKNLGLIKSMSLDLSKKLILFCGSNSTGKTYVSYLLEAFLSEKVILKKTDIDPLIKSIKKDGSFTLSLHLIQDYITLMCDIVKNHLGNIYGISDEAVEKLFGKLELQATYSQEEFVNNLEKDFVSVINENGIQWKVRRKAGSDQVTIVCEDLFDSLTTNNWKSLISSTLVRIAFDNQLGARMLTVERNSIYTFKTELSISRNELIDRIQQANKSEINVLDILSSSSRRYPQTISRSLRVANDLETIQKSSSDFDYLASKIEDNILHGQVSTNKSGDVEYHAQTMAAKQKLPFHLSSSIVKTLASLVIYLRHIGRKGETLIIDEPEMNFHPDVQIELARIFALLVNQGLKMVMSTHSDYIIREINNLLMVGYLLKLDPDNSIDGYDKEMGLNADEISVMYFARKSKRIVKVESLPISNSGFDVPSIDEAIVNQNLNTENLYAIILEKEDNENLNHGQRI